MDEHRDIDLIINLEPYLKDYDVDIAMDNIKHIKTIDEYNSVLKRFYKLKDSKPTRAKAIKLVALGESIRRFRDSYLIKA